MSGHSIAGKAKCHEPEGANCRLQGMNGCECESWTIERDPDGKPFHMVVEWDDEKRGQVEVRHEMMPTAYCNVVNWLDEMDHYDLLEECQADRALVIGATPIEPIWEGDYYSWKPIDPEPPTASLFDPDNEQLRKSLAWHAKVTTDLQGRIVAARHHVISKGLDPSLLLILDAEGVDHE